jgi:hypothetical protein
MCRENITVATNLRVSPSVLLSASKTETLTKKPPAEKLPGAFRKGE